MNLPELLKIKFPDANFITDIKLQDVGNGPEIYKWNLESPQPSADDITNWMNDPTVIATYTTEQNAIINAPIIAQLDIIDAKSIRALRTNDTERLTTLEAQAAALRAKLV